MANGITLMPREIAQTRLSGKIPRLTYRNEVMQYIDRGVTIWLESSRPIFVSSRAMGICKEPLMALFDLSTYKCAKLSTTVKREHSAFCSYIRKKPVRFQQ